MGRGRQKAKHTKVARELKYSSPDMNLSALERELGSTSSTSESDELIDKWADYADDDFDGEAEENPEAV
jgi:hypothetical protein